MLEEDEARQRILDQVELGPVVWMPVELARERTLAQEIRGIADFPEFDNSSMDGYAVRAADATMGATLAVHPDEQPAGIDRCLELEQGQAIRIFTGAPVPKGADAVIMQEDVTRSDQEITVDDPVVVGENIRRRGGDVCSGQKLMSPGTRLTPARLSLLHSQGIAEVPVYTQPMVHIITTGDELVGPGEPRMPGQIYDSNGVLLRSSVESAGGVAEQIHLADDPDTMVSAFEILCEVSDFLVIAGGVSVGDHDYVKPSLQAADVETDFWRVRVKPGKPFVFGRHPSGCLIFGLPGNPVSAFVTFQLFVAPAIAKYLGHPTRPLAQPLGIAGEVLENKGDRTHYLRAVDVQGQIHLSGTQQSHALFGLSKADCLVRIEADSSIAEGAPVSGIRLS